MMDKTIKSLFPNYISIDEIFFPKFLYLTFCCCAAAAAAAKFPAKIEVGDVAAEATCAAANNCWFVTGAPCC